jgi:hypothetical protein
MVASTLSLSKSDNT